MGAMSAMGAMGAFLSILDDQMTKTTIENSNNSDTEISCEDDAKMEAELNGPVDDEIESVSANDISIETVHRNNATTDTESAQNENNG